MTAKCNTPWAAALFIKLVTLLCLHATLRLMKAELLQRRLTRDIKFKIETEPYLWSISKLVDQSNIWDTGMRSK